MSNNIGNYDAKRELFQELKAHEELAELCKGGFHDRLADSDANLPRVVYTRTSNIPTGHADNKPSQYDVRFILSVYTDKQNVVLESRIEEILDQIMINLHYLKYDDNDHYEEETELFHKALRYEKKFNKNWEEL